MKKNIGMTEASYNLIVENLPLLELDVQRGIILNRNAKSLSKGYMQLGIKGKKVYQHQIFAVVRWGRQCIGMTVNHINEIRTDNSWGNIELLSLSENCKAKTTKSCRYSILPIKAVNIDTGEELTFDSQRQASKQLLIPQGSIFQNLNGQRHRAGRYRFERILA